MSSVEVIVCLHAYTQRTEKAHSFWWSDFAVRNVAAVGRMLEAACTKAYALLCMLYLHMIVYTLIEWIQHSSSIYKRFKRCIRVFSDANREDRSGLEL